MSELTNKIRRIIYMIQANLDKANYSILNNQITMETSQKQAIKCLNDIENLLYEIDFKDC